MGTDVSLFVESRVSTGDARCHFWVSLISDSGRPGEENGEPEYRYGHEQVSAGPG